MKNNKVIIGVVMVILVVGGFFIVNQKSEDSKNAEMLPEQTAMMEKTNTETPKEETMEKKEAMMEKTDTGKMMDKSAGSRYVPYSKKVLESTADKRRVLYFYATWCPSCKQANEDFTKNPEKIPDDVIVIRINYNDPDTDQEEKELAKEYGITYQHTFVQVDSSGKEIVKWNGGDTDDLIKNIK